MSNDTLALSYVGKAARGKVVLAGSKSISNRVLIIKALCEEDFAITNLSTSDDTNTLVQLLKSDATVLDAHHAGTTYRFMTAYLAASEGERTLTGSARMLQRPIGPLVDALAVPISTATYSTYAGAWTTDDIGRGLSIQAVPTYDTPYYGVFWSAAHVGG